MPQTRRQKVFISYSSKDSSIARDLRNYLDTTGRIDSWIYEERLSPNQDWGIEIEKAITDAEVLVVVVSKNSVKSKVVLNEIQSAIAQRKKIFPIRIDDVKIPEILSDYNFLQFY